MTAIRSNHGVMLEIGDHGDKDSPTFDVLTDTNKGITFTICDFNGLKSSSHFLDFILHFSEVHLGPLEFKIVIESVLAFFDVLPELLHPSDFYFNSLDDL